MPDDSLIHRQESWCCHGKPDDDCRKCDVETKRMMTLDEWVEKNAEDLARDIDTHLSVWDVEDASGLRRLIMISVRNWDELSR